MRFIFVILLALMITPNASYAKCQNIIDCYQQALNDLKHAQAEIKAVSIKADKLVKEYQTRLQRLEESYTKKMEGNAGLAQLSLESAKKDAKAIKALLDELGTSAEKVAKVTDAVSVSGDGNVGIGTNTPRTKLEIAQKHALRIGGAYLSSGDGNLAHLATNEWFNGHSWQASGDGALIQIYDKNINFYSHSKGSHTRLMTIKGDGKVGIGTGGNPQYELHVVGKIQGELVTSSDQRHKQNISPLENTLPKLAQLRGVSFEWKDKTQDVETQIGLIAQEVEKVLPELVSTDDEGYKSIAYGKLTAVLVEAVKEQQWLIEKKSTTIVEQQLSLQQQQGRISSLETRMEQMALQIETIAASQKQSK